MARLRSGPRAVAAAGLAETAAVSAPRGLAHNLVYLIYSVNRHDRFRHLLAIVVDFLKIEKVELPSFEKGEKQPRKHQEMEDLFPETPQFLPSFACGAGESLLCTQTILDCLFFHSRGLALEALSLAISCRELAIKPFAHHRVFLLPMPIQIRLSICGHDGALRGRLPIERAQEAVVLRFRVVH